MLTHPSVGVFNSRLDNANYDLIVREGDVLCEDGSSAEASSSSKSSGAPGGGSPGGGSTSAINSGSGRRYTVTGVFGEGTFGQVLRCVEAPLPRSGRGDGGGAASTSEDGAVVAIKVVKNRPAYFNQAKSEVGILALMNKWAQRDVRDGRPGEDEAAVAGRAAEGARHGRHIVRLHDWFVCKGHLCIATEPLYSNLYELLKRNGHRGLSLNSAALFLEQLLDALAVLYDADVIHADIKPENVLLKDKPRRGEWPRIRLIDFGSACFSKRKVYSYIQSRFYRAPEVVLGLGYGTAIDMWSVGCVAAELFLGLPVFPGQSEFDLLHRIVDTLGPVPEEVLARARNADTFFKRGEDGERRLLTHAEHAAATKKKEQVRKVYFADARLDKMIHDYQHKQLMSVEELAAETQHRNLFLDFLRGILTYDPAKRWTPREAASHPFITGDAWDGNPFTPNPELRKKYPAPVPAARKGPAAAAGQQPPSPQPPLQVPLHPQLGHPPAFGAAQGPMGMGFPGPGLPAPVPYMMPVPYMVPIGEVISPYALPMVYGVSPGMLVPPLMYDSRYAGESMAGVAVVGAAAAAVQAQTMGGSVPVHGLAMAGAATRYGQAMDHTPPVQSALADATLLGPMDGAAFMNSRSRPLPQSSDAVGGRPSLDSRHPAASDPQSDDSANNDWDPQFDEGALLGEEPSRSSRSEAAALTTPLPISTPTGTSVPAVPDVLGVSPHAGGGFGWAGQRMPSAPYSMPDHLSVPGGVPMVHVGSPFARMSPNLMNPAMARAFYEGYEQQQRTMQSSGSSPRT